MQGDCMELIGDYMEQIIEEYGITMVLILIGISVIGGLKLILHML